MAENIILQIFLYIINMYAIIRLKNNKAAGPDGLPAEFLRPDVMSW